MPPKVSAYSASVVRCRKTDGWHGWATAYCTSSLVVEQVRVGGGRVEGEDHRAGASCGTTCAETGRSAMSGTARMTTSASVTASASSVTSRPAVDGALLAGGGVLA